MKRTLLAATAALLSSAAIAPAATIGGVEMGDLPNYLMSFTNASNEANWQGASKGYKGDVAVVSQNATNSALKTSGSFAYSGTIRTDNTTTIESWQDIVDENSAGGGNPTNGAAADLGNASVTALTGQMITAIQQATALSATTGFGAYNWNTGAALNTQNGVADVTVVTVTDFGSASTLKTLTGDADDVFILRWDEDGDFTNGLDGQVKFQGGGGINVAGGLTPGSIINVAGNINSSGGGSAPAGLSSYLAEIGALEGGETPTAGGYFTGNWLTTGKPDAEYLSSGVFVGESDPMSNGIVVGSFATLATKISFTSGSSGVHVAPVYDTAPIPLPAGLSLLVGAFAMVGGLRVLRKRA